MNDNKEWVFSGAGLLVLTTLASLVTAFLSYWWRVRTEKRQRRRLRVSEDLTRYTLNSRTIGDDPATGAIAVSFGGKVYEHLALFSVTIENMGRRAIEGQELHFPIPSGTDILRVFEKPSLPSICVQRSNKHGDQGLQDIFLFSRLEPGDICVISYLLNLPDTEAFRCYPRGVDDIEYVRTGTIPTSEIRNALVLIAVIFAAGSLPYIGGAAQAVAILIGIPTLMRVVDSFIRPGIDGFARPSVKLENVDIDVRDAGYVAIGDVRR